MEEPIKKLIAIAAAIAILLLIFAFSLQNPNISTTPAANSAPEPPKPLTFEKIMELNNQSRAWKVIFELNVSGQSANTPQLTSNASSQPLITLYSQFSKGDRNSRIDITTEDALMQGVEMRLYSLASRNYICLSQLGKWLCAEGKNQSPQQVPSDILEKLEQSKGLYSPIPDGMMEIAGANSTCFRIENLEQFYDTLYPEELGSSGSMKMRFCYSPEAVPLYYAISADSRTPNKSGTVEMAASSYSFQVTDSDFELPSPPQKQK